MFLIYALLIYLGRNKLTQILESVHLNVIDAFWNYKMYQNDTY